jgi:hypothetical protein
MRVKRQIPYEAPAIDWVEEIRLEKAFLQGTGVSGTAGTSGFKYETMDNNQNSEWGGED